MNSLQFRRHPVSLALSLSLLASVMSLGACDSAATGPNNSCPLGEKRCACFSNDTCNGGLVCISDTCIEPETSGNGGSASTLTTTTVIVTTTTTPATTQAPEGTGGAQTTATTSNPVANSGGSGNDTVPASGNGGASTPVTTGAATGGTPQSSAVQTSASSGGNTNPASTTQTGNGGTTSVTTTNTTQPNNNSPVIDAFASCDDQIENNGGRSGKWYYFADDDFNATHGYGDPGTKWKDHGCAAWMILGCTGTACTYAGVGFQLKGGNPADVSSYDGVSIALEAGNDVYFVVKTSDGGYFGQWLTATSGNQTRNVDFAELAEMTNSAVSSLDPRLITEMQFTIGKTIDVDAGFGLAIHSVSLR